MSVGTRFVSPYSERKWVATGRVEAVSQCDRVHDRRDKKITDLEVSGRRTTLVWSRRRMVCDSCGGADR